MREWSEVCLYIPSGRGRSSGGDVFLRHILLHLLSRYAWQEETSVYGVDLKSYLIFFTLHRGDSDDGS